MKPLCLTVNGRVVSEAVESRTHLADFLRERLNLTATHLRCEQGACGACTVLVDGHPARSCITYTALCAGADVTTLEGLEDDPIMVALRRAFSEEHALQCGYCTPGMLVTARDIILRLPNADPARIRLELSGNLCRCTGYVGIVRAISRVLSERHQGLLPEIVRRDAPIGPVGARPAGPQSISSAGISNVAPSSANTDPVGAAQLGLDGRQPNVEIQQSFVVSRSPADVWRFFGDIAQVVPCLPGASLVRPPTGEYVDGMMAVKLGPITANFAGQARIILDDARQRGVILGSGNDQLRGSRATGEVEYALESTDNGGTRITLSIRALLTGPLAQFGRSGIVEDLVARITEAFSNNLEARLLGTVSANGEIGPPPLEAGILIRQIMWARLKIVIKNMFNVLMRHRR